MTTPAPRYLFVRILRHAEHAVFGVQDGQKTYRHPIFGRTVPYSSGQQVKRSILEAMLDRLGEPFAPVTITQVLKSSGGKKSLGDGEPLSASDPAYADQLIGGWMKAQKTDKTKSKKKAADEEGEGAELKRVLRRRSPLSISAMHPLHPLLADVSRESLTFDRSNTPGDHNVIVRDESGNSLMTTDPATGRAVPGEALQAWLDSEGEGLKLRTFMPEGKVGPRATGLFVVDVAVDLRRLYAVSLDPYDPEVDRATADALRAAGWAEEGGSLICPDDRRDAIAEALAHALVSWRITSNQSRTMFLQDTLAVAVSPDANLIGAAIRAELDDDGERETARLVVEDVSEAGPVSLFLSPALRTYAGAQALPPTSALAASRATAYLHERLRTQTASPAAAEA